MKRTLKDVFHSLANGSIGKIETFISIDDVPPTHIPLDGRTVNRADFSELSQKVDQNPSSYVGFTVTPTQLTVPDFTGYYLKYDAKNLGVKKTDTMRRIMGHVGSLEIGMDRNLGACYPIHGAAVLHNVGHQKTSIPGSKVTAVYLDSALGVEGQEGIHSPNVGPITEPQNIGVIFAIFAVGQSFDSFVFQEISDLPTTKSFGNKNVLLSSGELAPYVKEQEKSTTRKEKTE